MKEMSPDQIVKEISRQEAKYLQAKIFLTIMLVIAPIIVVIGVIISLIG